MLISLSIIIIGKNSSKTLDFSLDRCVHALKEAKSISTYELIYVDSRSTDNSIEIAEKHGCSIIKITEGFTSAALGRELGKNAASLDYLMFLDADMEVYPDWLDYATPHLVKYRAVTGERHELIYNNNEVVKDIPCFNKITKIQPLRYQGGFLMIERKLANTATFHALCRTEEEGDFYAQFRYRCTIMELPQQAFKHHNHKNISARFKHYLLPFRSIEYLYSMWNAFKKGYFKGFLKVQGRYVINIIASFVFYIGLFTLNPLLILVWFCLLLINGWHIIKGSIMTSLTFPYKLLMAIVFYNREHTSTYSINGFEKTIVHQ